MAERSRCIARDKDWGRSSQYVCRSRVGIIERFCALDRRLINSTMESPVHKSNHSGIHDSAGADTNMRTGFGNEAVLEISAALREVLADAFALYLKTKNFHWHVSGPHFRDYHLLFDEHADHIFAITDDIAERARKIGGTTLRSIGDIARHQRLKDNEDRIVPPETMVAELLRDNQLFATYLRGTHVLCEKHGDVATASLIETWIDQS